MGYIRTISERDYIAVVESRKRALSDLINASGMNNLDIGRATGLGRGTVRLARACVSIRYESACRIEYFLMRYLQEKEQTQNTHNNESK